MNFELLERAWRSSANSPSEAAKAYLMEEMMETLKRRRRDFRGYIALVAVMLTAWTAKIAYDVVFDPFPFDWSREWAVLPLFLLPWVALLFLAAQYQRYMKDFPEAYRSTQDTLRALIDENHAAQTRIRWMAGATAVCVLFLGAVLSQLMSVGKMTAQNVVQGSILFGTIFAVIWVYYGWYYFRRLRLEGERLRRLLADYEG